jgi:hypothetical protein
LFLFSNKSVFNFDLKLLPDAADRICSGSWFHSHAATTLNAPSQLEYVNNAVLGIDSVRESSADQIFEGWFGDIEEIFEVNWTFVVKNFECQEETFKVDSIFNWSLKSDNKKQITWPFSTSCIGCQKRIESTSKFSS